MKSDGIILSLQDKECIVKGERLNDLIINTVQNILYKQFPHLSGLQSTPYTKKTTTCNEKKRSIIIIADYSF